MVTDTSNALPDPVLYGAYTVWDVCIPEFMKIGLCMKFESTIKAASNLDTLKIQTLYYYLYVRLTEKLSGACGASTYIDVIMETSLDVASKHM